MKIIVVGLGSMGKRRIRLLKNFYGNTHTIIGVDGREDRTAEVSQLFDIKTYSNFDEAMKLENPDAALICTSPISHSDLILKALEYNMNVFTEINLLKDKYTEIMDLADKKRLKLFLSSTFMYRKETQFIQNRVKNASGKYHYRYHVGQYLPDWHPWECYKDFFVGDKKTNGCRELLAIELPWIINAFGKVVRHSVIRDKISSLELDYPDSYIITLEHESGHKGVISVDVVSRKATRDLEIYSENDHIFWNGTPESLEEYDVQKRQVTAINTYADYEKDKRYAESIIEDAYLEELTTFIDWLEDKECNVKYTFQDDLYTLSLIDQIEGII